MNKNIAHTFYNVGSGDKCFVPSNIKLERISSTEVKLSLSLAASVESISIELLNQISTPIVQSSYLKDSLPLTFNVSPNDTHKIRIKSICAKSNSKWTEYINEETSLSMMRISKTEYLIEGYTPNALIFRRLSDNVIDDKGVQTSFPYTFTHTIGEKWELSIDGGVTYKKSYGLRLSSGKYIEPELITDLATIELGKFYTNMSQIGSGTSTYEDIIIREENTYKVFKLRVRSNQSYFSIYLRNSSSPINTAGVFTSNLYYSNITWFEFSQQDAVKLETSLSSDVIAGTEHFKGYSPNGKTKLQGTEVGYWDIYGFVWNNEWFYLKEGSGLVTYGENGTKLNLSDANIWVEV